MHFAIFLYKKTRFKHLKYLPRLCPWQTVERELQPVFADKILSICLSVCHHVFQRSSQFLVEVTAGKVWVPHPTRPSGLSCSLPSRAPSFAERQLDAVRNLA